VSDQRLKFRAAAADFFSRPAFYWWLAAIFGIRAAVLAALPNARPDASSFLLSGRALLADPAHLYDHTAAAIAQLHTFPLAGGPDLLGPPPAAYLAAPFALLPLDIGVAVWTAVDALALVAGLYLIYRRLRPAGVARPVFWLAAAYFPPLFADVYAGQRGGFILLLAALSIHFEPLRPLLAGAFGGLAACIKLYPAAMVVGPARARRHRYWAGLVGTGTVVMALSFLPLGVAGATEYLQRVLLPVLGTDTPDCGVDSVRGLFMRTLGGQPYALPAPGGIQFFRTPIDIPPLALGLTYLTLLLVVGSAVWAARRSGWSPLYGLSLGFALGALIPNEVYPYQMLPLLPLLLVVLVRSLEAQRGVLVALLAVGLLAFVRQPCALPFPNLWTVAALFLWAVCVCAAGLFRAEPGPVAGEPGG
jgi:hypothetical protein